LCKQETKTKYSSDRKTGSFHKRQINVFKSKQTDLVAAEKFCESIESCSRQGGKTAGTTFQRLLL
jgi:S-methylmethionine-dependent homocysteine/selenocysteine methylase